MRRFGTIGLLTALIACGGCEKVKDFPKEPALVLDEIRLGENLQGLADPNSLVLEISFTDGDGNLGRPSDTPDGEGESNLIFEYEELVDGEWVAEEPTEDNDFRIPFVEPEGQDPSQKGSITVVLAPFADPNTNASEVRYRFKAIDQDGNESNTITTRSLQVP